MKLNNEMIGLQTGPTRAHATHNKNCLTKVV